MLHSVVAGPCPGHLPHREENRMTKHEWKVFLAALGISEKAPVIEIPGHAIIAAEILRRAIRKSSRRTICNAQIR